MVEFVKSQARSIPNILVHVGNSSIAELLLKIISLEEIPEGQGIVPRQWLSQQNLIPSLVERLDPTLDIETHNTAAQTLLDIIAVSYQNVGAIEQEDGTPANVGGGNSLVDELKSEAMMRKIFGYMLDKNAPNATSSLSSGVIIMIELIRRYCSEIEQAEFQQHQFQTQMMQTGGRVSEFGIMPTTEKIKSLAVDLNDLLKVIGEKVEDFSILLEHPRNLQAADTTLGRVVPLGSERLRTCELFAEILHLQYLYFSSPLFERLVFGDLLDDDESMAENKADVLAGIKVDGVPMDVDSLSTGIEGINIKKDNSVRNVADELASISDLLVQSKALFFQFPWNNFLHSVVYDMIAKVFNTYSFTSQSSNFAPVGPDGNEIIPAPGEEGLLSPLEEKMKSVSLIFKKLILVQGRLTARITEAQRRNDYEVEQAKGVRLGYMGHLTYISDEVVKLFEKCLDDFEPDVSGLINSDDWQEYLSGILKETKDRDRQALGGVRPTHTGQPSGNFGKIDETDIPPLGAAPPPKKELGGGLYNNNTQPKDNDSDEEEEAGRAGELQSEGGDVTSDQMARFICRSLVSDFPDRGILGDDSDDDDGLGEAIEEELLLLEPGFFVFRFDTENPFPGRISELSFNEEDSKASGDLSDASSNYVITTQNIVFERFRADLRFAIVIPFTSSDISRLLNNLETLWPTFPPCESRLEHGRQIDLILYFHKNILIEHHLVKLINTQINASSEIFSKCFSSVRFMNALLSDTEDAYPHGASRMFFKLLHAFSTNSLAAATAKKRTQKVTLRYHYYNAFFYMEPDVIPCRRNWVDRLYEAAMIPGDFWMQGSILRDRNPAVENWTFAGHINGNALYRVDDPLFVKYVGLVEAEMAQDIDGGLYLHSYDVALDLVRQNRTIVGWIEYTQMAAKFQYTDTIQNWYRTRVNATLVCLENEATYLVHGREVHF
ncbi:hypothetical protein HK100_000690 [Physocladia obscura]|uniref:Uncharacterized protein n=1 Tax=Physocladia obscura TaxID=109957 RepID=A0AAD5T829_9FUNG|nr:hypothetical protein HK100_000690 [Physocladia obscura]